MMVVQIPVKAKVTSWRCKYILKVAFESNAQRHHPSISDLGTADKESQEHLQHERLCPLASADKS